MRIFDRAIIRPFETIQSPLFDVPGKAGARVVTTYHQGPAGSSGITVVLERPIGERTFVVDSQWRSFAGTIATNIVQWPVDDRKARIACTGEHSSPVCVTLDIDAIE